MNELLKNCLIVAGGSGLGGVARYLSVLALAPRISEMWAITLVNILGAFIIGAVAQNMESTQWRLLLMTGVLGGFTTFSTFSLQTVQAFRDGLWLNATTNIFASLLCCFAGTFLALVIFQK